MSDEPLSGVAKAKSFIAVTGATVVSRLFGRGGLLPESAIQARLDICQACDQLGSDGKCPHCGCACNGRVEWLNKLAHPTSHCPLPAPKW